MKRVTGNTLVPGKASETELCRMMDEYSSMLVGICAILLDDRDLAQDVVQETFIRVYKKMDSFRGARPESEKAWLTRIAVNLCRDEKRKSWFRLRERAKSIDMTAIPMEDATEEARELYAAVQALPKKYREVILLYYYQDLTAQEIAAIFHQATGSIYHKLSVAQQMLKKTLGGV